MPLNAQTRRHAEAEVFQQALNKGLQAEKVITYVDWKLCDACGPNGGIGSMLRATGISAVEVVVPDGRFLISANRPSVPVRIGDLP